MKLLIFFIIALLFSSFFLMNKSTENNKFKSYKVEWKKQYESVEEEQFRMTIFYENLALIEAHNATPGITYWEAINDFTD